MTRNALFIFLHIFSFLQLGVCPLMWACYGQSLSVIKLLQDNNADVNVRDRVLT